MEERILDEDGRKIKVKKSAVGGIADVTENGEEGTEESEISLEIPELDETDEDLIGLSPTQLQEELERRERALQEARAERDRLLEEGERLLKKSAYKEAEPFFVQTLLYDDGCSRAKEALWICRTEDFENPEALYEPEYADALSEIDEKTRAFILKHTGEQLRADKARYEEEAAPLRGRVRTAQSERRDAFSRNRNYYLIRFTIFATAMFVFLIALVVSASFIVRTKTNVPIILTAVFGGLSLISAIVMVAFSRKLYVAQRLVSENEKLSSTEEGARLYELEEKLETLNLLLGE